MLSRYTRPVMATLWGKEEKYRIWLEIECLVAEAQAQLGLIPSSVPVVLREKGGRFSLERIEEIEEEVQHEVLAFLTAVAESIGEEGNFTHYALTSSDVLDTAFSVQLTRGLDIVLEDNKALLGALQKLACTHARTLCVGRSHGMSAEPMTFGLKILSFYAEFSRAFRRLRVAREEVATAQISGPVGLFSFLSPEVEAYVARKLGLTGEPISTQVIPRDRHGAMFAALGVVASSIERLAVEIRHLSRAEVGEVSECFGDGQKGSSSMPHKKNPILAENLTGLARLVRMNVIPALENVALWHERDISHSSVERVIAPSALTYLDFALVRLTEVLETLKVYPQVMVRNLEATGGVIFSHALLLALVRGGMSRKEAYRKIQQHAFKTQIDGGDYRTQIMKDSSILTCLGGEKAVQALFDTDSFFPHVDAIFQRVWECYPLPS